MQRKLGVILSYVSEFVKILSSLIYTPIMLRLISQSEYGLYQLVYSVVSYLGLLSFGFGSSYMRFYSRLKNKEDENGIARLNGMFLLIFLVIAFICIISGAIMIFSIDFLLGNGLSHSEIKIARILMLMMVINLAVTFPNSVFESSIIAHERFIYQKGLIIIQNLLSPFLTLPLLILGYGSIGMVFVTTCLTITVLVSNIYFCKKKLKLRFIFHQFNFCLFKEMGIFTFYIFLNQVIDQLNWSIDKVLLGRYIGTVAVAIYGLGSQINAMYLQFATSISSVFIPNVNRIVAETDDNNQLTDLMIKVGRIQFVVLALILSGFILFGKPFIIIWAGEEYLNSYFVTLLLIIPVTFSLVQSLGIEVQRAKNKHKARSVVYLFISIGNVFLTIPLITYYGEIGAALGTAISLLCGNVLFMNWYYYRKIGLDIFKFWKSVLKLLFPLVIPVIVGIMLNIGLDLDEIFTLSGCIVVYSLVYGISVWLFGFSSSEKKMILSLFRDKG